ncbi:MAG: hypothetical protein UU93_C0009G0017 [Candidatus Amesbacteria bacterium GW2011_GWA2_42_12]|uniref:Uncharacterized protein n=1 Tax=Candidatus Amesbacteria bacterium GW2011_GWA2_42_12 TaxID=1618356 RepID=A0A0G0Y605_9BACT|nr:MAG: hypothetical protein UU93_C0009G0017 [Candidatus Amesbacteria bacterium GW2011_GWA2_42_12]
MTNQLDITTAAYTFLVISGLITVFGAITVYLLRQNKRKHK